MNIVNFSGKAQAGKTSASNILTEMLTTDGSKVIQVNYADYLKFICKEYFGWNGKKDEEGRSILQKVGTDIVRQRHPTFWVEAVGNFISVFGEDFDYALIGDCRFKNEANYFKGKYYYNTLNVRVNRIDFDNGLTEEQMSHASEVDLDDYDFDYYINSKSGLDNLRVEIYNLFKYMKKE